MRLALEGPDKLAGMVAEVAGPGDYVVCLGAGNITQWAYALPGELKALAALDLLASARRAMSRHDLSRHHP